MSRGPLVVLGWAVWLTVLAAVLVVWRPADRIQWIPFATAAAITYAVGLVLLARRQARSELRIVPDLSPGTVVLALGLATMLGALPLGRWLALVGGGISLLGLAVLAREALAERRLRR